MARTPSTMLPLGTPLPLFELPDANGRLVALAALRAPPQQFDAVVPRPVLVMFLCNHCPYVVHVADELAALTTDYLARRVAVIGVNANDVEAYPEDSPEKMREESARRGYRFPYVLDETQAVARAYRAACTPDFYLFDAGGHLVYRGQLDGARPGNGVPVTGADLRAALDAVLAGRPVPDEQSPSLGCGIKWKPEQAPRR